MTNRKPISPLMRFASSLRFPQLFLMALALFAVDLIIPDLVPFIDEVLLGLITLLLANWRKQKKENNEERRFENAKRVSPE